MYMLYVYKYTIYVIYMYLVYKIFIYSTKYIQHIKYFEKKLIVCRYGAVFDLSDVNIAR